MRKYGGFFRQIRIVLPTLFAIVSLIVMYASSVHELSHVNEFIEQESVADMRQVMSIMQGVFDTMLKDGDVEGVEHAVSAMHTQKGAVAVLVLDENNMVKKAEPETLEGISARQAGIEFSEDEISRIRQDMAGVVRISADRSSVVGAYPIIVNPLQGDSLKKITGILYKKRSIEADKTASIATHKKMLLFNGLGLALCCFVLWIVIQFLVLRQVNRLKDAMYAFSKGDMAVRAEGLYSQEFDEIGAAFNQMADTMARDKAALTESLAYYRLLFEHAGDFVFIFEIDDNGCPFIKDVNKAACQAHGYEYDELVGKSMTLLDPVATPEKVAELLDICAKNGGNHVFSVKHIKKDGSFLYAETRIVLLETIGRKVVFSVERDVTERRKLERKMALLSQAIDNVKEAVFLADNKGQLRYVNQEACKSLGYTHDELIAMTVSDVDSDVLPGMWQGIFSDIKQNGAMLFEGHHRAKSGALIPVEIYSNYYQYEEEEFALGLVRDITERQKAEQIIKDSENKYRIVSEYATDWEFWLAPDGSFIYVSPACKQVSGYSAQEFYDNPALINEIVYPDDQEILHGHCKVRGHCYDDISYRIVCKDKRIKWVHHVCQPVYDTDGIYLGIRGSNRDMTTLKNNELWLEKRLELREFSITHSLNEVVKEALMDAERNTGSEVSFFHLIEADQKTVTLQIWSDNTVNKLCSRDFDGRHLPVDEAGVWADAIRERKPVIHNDYKALAHKKGIPQGHVDVTREIVVPIFKGAQIVAILGVGNKAYEYDEHDMRMLSDFGSTIWDIVQRKMADQERDDLESQLRQAQKMEAIGTLAGGIAHDFNNILTILIGFAEIADMQLPKDSPVRAHLTKVLKAGDRAKDLVKQILTFSRRTEQERQPLQVNLLVKESLKLLRASIPTTINIKEAIDPATGLVNADPTQIHQILMNLCTNAYHAMREKGGELAISLKPIKIEPDDMKVKGFDLAPGQYAKLEVSDTGCGMNKETLARIFEPYFTTKPKGEGTGLGLAVVHGIVKGYGGHITVYSEEGAGTTFKIYLPRVAGQEKIEVNHKNVALPTGTQRILVVDDDENLVMMEKHMLEALGYKVTLFTDSPKALEAFLEAPMDFDLVLTDMTMPAMTGLELFNKIRKVRPDIPVIMCTGFSELIDKPKAMALGIKEFLEKPLNQRVLAEAVSRVVGSQKQKINGVVGLA